MQDEDTQTAASLCSVLNSQELSAFAKTIYEQKREEFLKRDIATEFQEEAEKWTDMQVAEAKLRLGFLRSCGRGCWLNWKSGDTV